VKKVLILRGREATAPLVPMVFYWYQDVYEEKLDLR